jgi:hypothetical protein
MFKIARRMLGLCRGHQKSVVDKIFRGKYQRISTYFAHGHNVLRNDALPDAQFI